MEDGTQAMEDGDDGETMWRCWREDCARLDLVGPVSRHVT